jgi:hypothetical protein
MNHRTPAEDFRAALAALTREQLEEAMHYLRDRDPRAMDRALQLVTTPVGAAAHNHDDADLPWTSGAHEFIPCTSCAADACNACSRPAGDAVHQVQA